VAENKMSLASSPTSYQTEIPESVSFEPLWASQLGKRHVRAVETLRFIILSKVRRRNNFHWAPWGVQETDKVSDWIGQTFPAMLSG